MAFVGKDMLPYGHAYSCESLPVRWAGVAPKFLAGGNKEIRAYPERKGGGDVRVKFNPSKGRADVIVPQEYLLRGI